MPTIAKTMKLRIKPNKDETAAFKALTERYTDACTYTSAWLLNDDENRQKLQVAKLQESLYNTIREDFGLKAQFSISVLKTVVARYKTVKNQFAKKPYKYQDANGKYCCEPRTLEWLTKPIAFSRPQADLVYNRDYSFLNGMTETRRASPPL